MDNLNSDLNPQSDNSVIMNLHRKIEQYETEIKGLRVTLKECNNKLLLTRKRLREELKKPESMYMTSIQTE